MRGTGKYFSSDVFQRLTKSLLDLTKLYQPSSQPCGSTATFDYFLPLAFPRLLEELTKPLHHVPRGFGAPLAFVPGEVVVAGDVGPVPAVVDLGLLGVGAHLPGVEPLAVASLRPHVAPPVVRLAPGVDVAVPLSG